MDLGTAMFAAILLGVVFIGFFTDFGNIKIAIFGKAKKKTKKKESEEGWDYSD